MTKARRLPLAGSNGVDDMNAVMRTQTPAGRRNACRALGARRSTRDLPRNSFTLVELLAVIGVIAFLLAILGVVLANMADKAREAATNATIKKIHTLLEQRVEAFGRTMDPQLSVLVRKDRKKSAFPQRYLDLDTSEPKLLAFNNKGKGGTPDDARLRAESAEVLYFMLTQMNVAGATPVDASEFLASELGDTDGDGVLEFIDAWGNPLRFYRWPTRLIRPGGCLLTTVAELMSDTSDTLNVSPDNAVYPATGPYDIIVGSADKLELMTVTSYSSGEFTISEIDGILQRGLNRTAVAHLTGEKVRQAPDVATSGLLMPALDLALLDSDPDDPYDQIGPTLNETLYHTVHTYHVPLVVSAGADGELGLGEPNSSTAAERLALVTNASAITDNITNRNKRTGD
jgi:type II secretory pathway pseudopilin PulG